MGESSLLSGKERAAKPGGQSPWRFLRRDGSDREEAGRRKSFDE